MEESILGWMVVLSFPSSVLSFNVVGFKLLGCSLCGSLLFMCRIFKLRGIIA